MKTKHKLFDCVQMKNDIQSKLRKEFEGIPEEEIRRKMMREIEQSNTPYAQALREKQTRDIFVI